ncbi:hypothetical protein [Ilumatobacter coccineus]|uniref:LicD family protein n=1 Tax=Ilumatobacter coccineus (strain NBRC 103263 / KCTC 29153 / YM16-304) TaxID=1313172 RepID=A0A6C7E6I1_ILUCY|nr:hypothetical protein [Ilumatobacter coccineus]BAN03324.1 hypothetical protein YM304_30100 [Ilumatobacter coccineus YM16-304]
MLSLLRDRVLRLIDRSSFVRTLTVRLLALGARRSGAVEPVVDEAVEGRDRRPTARTAQMIMWARRVTQESSDLPTHFDPAEHLTSEHALDAARRAVEHRLESQPGDDVAARQLLRLVPDRRLVDLARDVEGDIQTLLHRKATTASASKGGIAPELQLEITAELTERLAEIDVRPFLMSGTLLGIVRDGDFMAHDYDIDLGLMPDTDLATIPDFVRRMGYETTVEGDRIVALHSSGARTDLFPHTRRDGKFWHGSLVHEWWNTPFDLAPMEMKGHRLFTPDDPKRYLDENYGDWSRPVAFYDISFDTPNRVYRQNADALLHLHSRCVIALRTNDRWLLESAARELRDNFGIDVTDFLAASRLL